MGTDTPFKVVVVANTGENDTIQQVRADYPDVSLIVNDQPRSFAANHNAVMASTVGPFIALLNDDLVVEKGALDTLVGFLESHPGVAVVGPRLLYPDGSLQPSTFGDPSLFKAFWKLLGISDLLPPESPARGVIQKLLRPLFPKPLARYWEHDRAAEAQVLKGAATVVRRAAFEKVGPMAEVALAYGEEEDWHWRFRKAGWRVYLAPDARIIHYGGKSTGGQRGRMLIEARKALLHYFYHHRSRHAYDLLRWAILITHTVRWMLTWLPGLFSPTWRDWHVIHRAIVIIAWRWPDGA